MICKRCDKGISKFEKFTALITCDKEEFIEKVYFHFKCFVDNLEEMSRRRAELIIKSSTQK